MRPLQGVHSLAGSLLCLLLAVLPGTGRADARSEAVDARALLAAMSDAMRALDYQGSFTYQHAGRVDTLRIFHAGAPIERERLVSLNGPRSEIVRNGTEVTCIQADGSAVVYSISSGRGLVPLVPETGGRALDAQYDIRHAGNDRVAGYRADIIDIAPRDRFRYGYRLWIDQGSRLLLRSIVTDAERRPLEQLMFVSLDIGRAPLEADLVPQRSESTTTSASPATELPVRGKPHWRVVDAPDGFGFVSARRPRLGPEGAEHLVYSDGLATVSIYVEPRGDSAPGFDTLAGRGTVNVFSRVEDTWRITVLGEVPLATVQAIGQNLRRD